MAVGGGLVATWNGVRWSAEALPGAQFAGGPHLQGVDCVSSAACVAIGDAVASGKALLFGWNGRAWFGHRLGTGVAGVDWTDLSCSRPDACVVLGSGSQFGDAGSPVAFVWGGSRRATVHQWPEDRGVNGVSCTSSATCIAVGSVIATIHLR
jgi:hypothetical protein